ncbi:MAG: LysR family transcriptional regulator [Myxococcaceae bacterium]
MHVTLEQARALDALARHGTFQGAAKALHKVHTAVLYAIRGLEAQCGLELLDRRGYRTRLTPAGERVLLHCRRMLEVERELADECAEMQSGWEPSLRVVFDGVYPAGPILDVLGALRGARAPTRLHVIADFLDGVEQRFIEEDAHVMITVLPVKQSGLEVLKLPALPARLVAHRNHPLARHRGTLTAEQLASHILITVRGGDPRLELSTAPLEQHSTVRLSDFHSKKAAILGGIGFGWLPDWLAQPELKRGELVQLKVRGGNLHSFEPRLYHRPGKAGRAAQHLIESLSTKG